MVVRGRLVCHPEGESDSRMCATVRECVRVNEYECEYDGV